MVSLARRLRRPAPIEIDIAAIARPPQPSRLAEFGRNALTAALLLAMVVLAAGCQRELGMWTDGETGCQYLASSRGMTPRLGLDRQPMGCGAPQVRR